MKRGRLERIIALLEAATPEMTNHNDIGALSQRTNINCIELTTFLPFLVEKNMLTIVFPMNKKNAYHRKIKRNKKCYVITPLGQKALADVRNTGLMDNESKAL